jgi:sterol desaturase/sphingolipid hydroxylase (fatty acid hydroxylase superfamily)
MREKGWGLFPALGIPPLLAGILSFVILDFAVWLEHVASHKIPILWRIHRMHHADNGFDVTTALRFHPIEIVAVDVLEGGNRDRARRAGRRRADLRDRAERHGDVQSFQHQPAAPIDRWLRRVIVTPDMHRVHHSSTPRETDSNYGFNFPFWDRLFRTYNAQPKLGHEGMEIGLKEYRGPVSAGLLWALRLPFTRL